MRFSRMSKSTVERTTSTAFLLVMIFGCIATMSTAFTLPYLATEPSRAASQLQHPFHFHRHQHRRDISALLMMMDPVEMATATNTVWGYLHDVASAATSVDTAAPATSASTSSMEAILSTMYAQASTLPVVEAHGHSQPLWGPADPYLMAGKSIAPPVQNLIDMDITASSTKTLSTAADAAGSTNGGAELSRTIQEEMSKGWKFLDYNNIQIKNLPGAQNYQGYMPGFVDPSSSSLLAQPEARLYPDYNETPETFVLMVKWAAGLINVVDKLPTAAFFYALIEFFILRPNLDSTKRELQNDPSAALAESVATTSVRLTVFVVVALLTLVIFG